MTRSVLQRRGSAAPKKKSHIEAGAQAAPLELRFVEGRGELIAAAREAIAAGARTIRIEPAEAAAEFISALAAKPRSGLRFVSTAKPHRNRPSSSARVAPEIPVDVVVIAASDAEAVSASFDLYRYQGRQGNCADYRAAFVASFAVSDLDSQGRDLSAFQVGRSFRL